MHGGVTGLVVDNPTIWQIVLGYIVPAALVKWTNIIIIIIITDLIVFFLCLILD